MTHELGWIKFKMATILKSKMAAKPNLELLTSLYHNHGIKCDFEIQDGCHNTDLKCKHWFSTFIKYYKNVKIWKNNNNPTNIDIRTKRMHWLLNRVLLYILDLCTPLYITWKHGIYTCTRYSIYSTSQKKRLCQLIGLFSPNLVITNFMQCFLYGPIG